MTSRRRFLGLIGTTAAGSLLLHGCLGNPPQQATGGATPSGSTQVADANLETRTITLGYVPILEAAPSWWAWKRDSSPSTASM